jgi:two-component system, LytTR family, sensor kinase
MTLSLVLLWGAAVCYTLVVTAISARLVGAALPGPPWIVEQIVLLLFWAAATPAILWSARRFPLDRRGRRLAYLGVHLLFAFAFILATNLLAPVLTRLILGQSFDVLAVMRLGLLNFLQVYHLALIVYAFIVGVGHYLPAREAHRAQQLRAERLRASLAEARLRALQLQLEPHMLFNALNAIGALVIIGKRDEAFDAIGRLGDLLRAVLASESRQEVSLREELRLTESYLAIERARLGDRLDARWEIAPGIETALIPPLLLQPLVENAVRHGVARKVEGGRVVVRADRVGERLRLEVRDDGPGMSEGAASGSGIGLENARRRLEHLYGPEHRLDLERTDDWTRVSIELPYHGMDERSEAA